MSTNKNTPKGPAVAVDDEPTTPPKSSTPPKPAGGVAPSKGGPPKPQVEVARPSQDNRHPYEKLPSAELEFFRVTETDAQRNLGLSIVQDKLERGWIIPNDPALKRPSPNGLSFNMVKPKKDVIASINRENERARRMEGFNKGALGGAVKNATKEESRYKGQEIIDKALSEGVRSDEHDG